MKQDYNKSDFGFGAVVGNDFTSYPFNAMKYDYNASIPNPIGSNSLTIDSEIINNSLIDCDHIQHIKKDIELLANDTSKDLNGLQSELYYITAEIYGNKAIADQKIEKLQKELQEFKKTTKETQNQLIATCVVLLAAIIFIILFFCHF